MKALRSTALALICGICFLQISGCSLFIDIFNASDEDFSRKIKNGSSRSDVEDIFGRPIEECKKSDDIYVCHYKYDYDCTFNEYPAFGKLAIITLGLSEIIMTPYAIYDCGKTNIIKFAYDYNNAVLTFLIGDFEIKPLNSKTFTEDNINEEHIIYTEKIENVP